jgi:hypothetical protein
MKNSIVAAAALAALSGSAFAAQYEWNWTPATGGIVNNNAGAYESIRATYDTSNQRFVWQVVFGNQVTDGLTIAVNNGSMPSGQPDELAMVHFDFSSGAPLVSVYRYNGADANNSWRDGDGNVSGLQPVDVIHRTNDTSWRNASVVDAGGKRTFSLDLDASLINGFSPTNLGSNGVSDWEGIGFDQGLGLWMHSYDSLSTAYSNGALTQWNYGSWGLVEGSGFHTVLVPLPPAAWAGIGGLAAVGFVSRRRKQAMTNQA